MSFSLKKFARSAGVSASSAAVQSSLARGLSASLARSLQQQRVVLPAFAASTAGTLQQQQHYARLFSSLASAGAGAGAGIAGIKLPASLATAAAAAATPLRLRAVGPLASSLASALARRGLSTTTTATPSTTTTTADTTSTSTSTSSAPGLDIVTVIPQDRLVASWLFAVAGLVFAMVVLGGLTRLTKSGLSMVHWRFTGEKRPATAEEWEGEFALYKQSPEYRLHNQGMSLSEFKFIWHMEYGHRTLGRVIGLVYGLPMLGFLLSKRVPLRSPLAKSLTVLLALGGAQGLVGWWMVRSGLTEEDNKTKAKVSPYRLATHLISAFALFGLLMTTGMRCWAGKHVQRLANGARQRLAAAASAPLKKVAHAAAMLAGLTAASGAFVAGNDAGLIYNEFPLMGGLLVPSDLVNEHLQPAWRNAFEHPTMVQFTHRCLAITTATLATGAFALSRMGAKHAFTPAVRRGAALLFGAVAVQVALGITTLLSHVQTHVAATHQAGALVVLASAINLVYSIANPPLSFVSAGAGAGAASAGVKAAGLSGAAVASALCLMISAAPEPEVLAAEVAALADSLMAGAGAGAGAGMGGVTVEEVAAGDFDVVAQAEGEHAQ